MMLRLCRRPLAFAVAAISFSFASIAGAEDAPTTQTVPKEIALTIVDAETQKPISGASVWVRLDPGGSIPLQKTDDDGKLVVPLRDPAIRYVSCLAAAPGRAMMRVTWSEKPLAIPAAYEFALPKGTTVGGVVTDADGQPIPEAKLTLTFEMDGLPPNVSCGATFRQIVADAQGKWSFGTAPDQWKSVRLGSYDLERGGNDRGYFEIAAIEGADAEKLRDRTHELRLEPARQIVGRVVDANGKPIPGATVTLGEGRGSNALPAAKVDRDGTYLIGVKPDAAVTLTFAAKGFAPELIRVTNTAELGAVDQIMQPAKQMTGQVVGPDGTGIANARIYVDTWRGSRSLSRQLSTNTEGRFTWNDAPADAVAVSASAPGFASSRDVTIAPEQPNVIRLQRPVVFRGKVIDAETKQPIEGVATDIGIVFSKEQSPYFRSADGSERPNSAADGTFRIDFDVPYFGRIVRVEKDGYARADSAMVTMDGGDQTFTFEMKRSAGLTGNVVDAAGKPAAGVVVLIATPGNAIRIVNGESPERLGRDVLGRTTDATGKFTFPSEDGDFVIIASGTAGYARIDKATFKAEQPIALAAWSKIEGDAFIGSKPAAGASVQAWASEPYAQNKPQVQSSLSAKVDSAGHFVIDRVPAGTWQIGRYTQVGDEMWTISSSVSVDAKPGEGHTIRIGGNGRPVVGRVEIPAELEAKRNWFFFHFELVPKADAMPPQPKTPEQMAAMTDAERKAFLESPEWQTWIKAFQAAQAKQRRCSGWLKPDGSFRVEDVPPGTYTAQSMIMQRPADQPRGFGNQLGGLVPTEITVEAGDPDEAFEAPILEVKLNATP